MPLADVKFSDLLLLPDAARLKGCPGAGPQLIPVPEDCAPEVDSLRESLSEHRQSAMRHRHGGITYRAARIDNVDGRQTWFLRRLADAVPDFSGLGLSPRLSEWLLAPEQRQGLVLFSGPQASGKTTAASAYVAGRLALYGGHGVAFECPAELPLDGDWGKFGYCCQTEIAGETELAREIERAHRYGSPDVIFIGEIRTRHAALEALRVALGSSRQLVVSTIHGLDVVAALTRLITWAQELDGSAACQNLADALLAVIHLSLDGEENAVRRLGAPQFLLLPFSGSEYAGGIRAKLRDNKLLTLPDDMRALKARIARQGAHAI